MKRIKPEFCCFGIIDECFLRCKMCHKWKPDQAIVGVPQPDTGQWKKAIKSLRSVVDEGFLINFGGGEALLKKDLLELVNFSSRLGFRTNIATNAVLIDEEMAKRIGQSGLSSVNISLDSMKESTHDYLRGVEGVYKKAIKAIEYLDKHCPPDFEVIICCAIYDINMREVVEVAQWVNSHPRLKWVYFMAAMQPNNTQAPADWQRGEFSYLWPRDKEVISRVMDELLDRKKNGYKISNQVCQLEAFKKYFLYPERFVKKTACNLDKAVHISSIGNIYICYDWGCLGNIITDELSEVLYSPQAGKVRQDIAGCKKNCHHLINCFFEGDYPFEIVDTDR